MKKNNNYIRMLLVTVLLVLFFSFSAQAAKYKSAWVSKSGKWYYYDKNGKKLKGIQKIKNRYYYFNEKGVVQYGWKKIGKYYYCFRNRPGAGAWMRRGTKRYGIKLKKNGHAVVSSDWALRKVRLMMKYQKWVDSFTKPTMTRNQKLFACLRELQKFSYRSEGDGLLSDANWDISGAEQMLLRKSYGAMYGNCYLFAASFGYMANAVGYSDVQVCAYYGHGWVLVNGVIYDPAKTINRNDMSYFPVSRGRYGEYTTAYRKILNEH